MDFLRGRVLEVRLDVSLEAEDLRVKTVEDFVVESKNGLGRLEHPQVTEQGLKLLGEAGEFRRVIEPPEPDLLLWEDATGIVEHGLAFEWQGHGSPKELRDGTHSH
jgi:hypothetical protein